MESIFGGNCSTSGKIFTLQKKIRRIVAGAKPRTSCSSLFKQLEILPVPCQDILSLMTFLISNQGNFETDSSMHNMNARNKNHLNRPIMFSQKYILCIHHKFQQFTTSSKIPKNDEVKF